MEISFTKEGLNKEVHKEENLLQKAKSYIKDQFLAAFVFCLSLYQVRGTSNKMMHLKQANFQEMSALAKGMIIFGVVIVLGVTIVANLQDSQTKDSLAYNLSGDILGLFATLTGFGGIIVVVVIAVVVIGYLYYIK